MAGYSLHIGLNLIDPSHYGTNGRLHGCESDARDMKGIADSNGFTSSILLTNAATTSAVLARIAEAANILNNGDIFFISYSGHGGQVPDTNGDEPDHVDETWCLYDCQLIDDQLFGSFGLFRHGVRILVLSDSCHSGTVTRMIDFERNLGSKFRKLKDENTLVGIKTLPQGRLEETYRRHKDAYDRIQVENPRGNRALLSASIILISGCQDWQLSGDGPTNGVFTGALLEVWAGGAFAGSYIDFHQAIYNRMPSYQQPNYFRQGLPNPEFETQKPFQV